MVVSYSVVMAVVVARVMWDGDDAPICVIVIDMNGDRARE